MLKRCLLVCYCLAKPVCHSVMGCYCNPTQTRLTEIITKWRRLKGMAVLSWPIFGPDLFCDCNTSKFSFLCSLVWIKSWMSVVKFAPFNSLLSLFMIKRRVVPVSWWRYWLGGGSEYSISVLSHHWLVYKVADSAVDMSAVTLGLHSGPGWLRGLVSNYTTWSHWALTTEHWQVCLPSKNRSRAEWVRPGYQEYLWLKP